MYYIWIGIVVLIILASLKVVNEFERGVKFTLGRYTGIMGPGLRMVFPLIQTWQRVDMRTKVVDVPDQECMTKDNVSVKVNAALYYNISDSSKAILKVEHFGYAVSQLAQTTMRDVIGEAHLDVLLAQRENVSKRIQTIVDKASEAWGVDVEGVELKHIELPENMKRVMAAEAEAEREKRAVIIQAEGELEASKNMAKAAEILTKNPGALHLRTLQTINDVGSDQNNTIVFAVPVEILRAFEQKPFGNK